jgi:hypothetical protein
LDGQYEIRQGKEKMRAIEFLTELRKKKVREPQVGDTTAHDYNPGWEDLNWLKQEAQTDGERLAGRLQLFVPRRNMSAQPARDRRMDNLANKYAWDETDPTQLKPSYAKWEQPRKDLSGTGMQDDDEEVKVAEGAPILQPGKASSPPGNNKPYGASLWTSSAIKGADGAYTSDWAKWTKANQPDWFNKTGYLYKVKPGALILELNSEYDAERIYRAFENIGTAKPIDHSARYSKLSLNFPWDQIAKHFDGVWHGGYRYRDGGDFMYGWDVESTAWFDTSFLTLVGQVPVVGYKDDEDVYS